MKTPNLLKRTLLIATKLFCLALVALYFNSTSSFVSAQDTISTFNNTLHKIDLGPEIYDLPHLAFHSLSFIDDYLILVGGSIYNDTVLPSSVQFDKIVQTRSENSNNINDKMYFLNTNTKTWYSPNVQNIPRDLKLHKTVVHNSNLIAYNSFSNKFNLFNFDLLKWIEQSVSFAISPLLGPSFVDFGDNEALLYGGISLSDNNKEDQNQSDKLYKINLNTLKSTELSNGNNNAFHSSCYLKKKKTMIVFGGLKNKNESTNDLYYYSIQNSNIWYLNSVVKDTGFMPSERIFSSLVCFDDYAILFGGCSLNNNNMQAIDNIIYKLSFDDDKTLTWSILKTKNPDNAPSPRYAHDAFNFKNKLYIYGGLGMLEKDTNVYVLDMTSLNWLNIPSPKFNSGSSTYSLNQSKTIIIAAVVSGALAVVMIGIIGALMYKFLKNKNRNKTMYNINNNNRSRFSNIINNSSNNYVYQTNSGDTGNPNTAFNVSKTSHANYTSNPKNTNGFSENIIKNNNNSNGNISLSDKIHVSNNNDDDDDDVEALSPLQKLASLNSNKNTQ